MELKFKTSSTMPLLPTQDASISCSQPVLSTHLDWTPFIHPSFFHRLAPSLAGSEGRNCWHSPEGSKRCWERLISPASPVALELLPVRGLNLCLSQTAAAEHSRKALGRGCLTIVFTIASLPLSALFSMELHTHFRLWIWFICKIWGEFQSLWKQ